MKTLIMAIILSTAVSTSVAATGAAGATVVEPATVTADGDKIAVSTLQHFTTVGSIVVLE